jgi:hypothetical protein
MLRWFPRLQVATASFSCSPPDLNFLDPYFIFMYMHNNYYHQVTDNLQLYYYYYYYIAHFLQQCYNSEFVIFQVRILKDLKCYNFL